MSGKVFLRIGAILLAIGLLCYFLVGQTKAREYEPVVRDYFYRATVTSVDEFTAAEAKTDAGTVAMLIANDQDRVEPWATIIGYGFRNHMRVTTLGVPTDGALSFAQIGGIISQIQALKHPPILMIGPDGTQAGKIVAAYRLAIEKMPLAEVERLAALPDAAPDTIGQVREFAKAYDQALRELAQKSPATTQAAPK